MAAGGGPISFQSLIEVPGSDLAHLDTSGGLILFCRKHKEVVTHPLFVSVGNDVIACCEECFTDGLIETTTEIGEARAATQSE